MNSGKKAALIIALCLIAAGLILGGVALAANRFHPEDLMKHGSTLESKTYSVSEPFTALEIHAIDGDVRLLPSGDGKCRVECMENEEQTHRVEVRGGTLYVERQLRNRVGVTFSPIERDYIRIYLPESDYEKLILETGSGDVECPAEFSFGEASVSTSSGDIAFRSGVEGALTVSATSGEVEIEGVSPASLSVSAASGSIRLKGVDAGDLSLSATSGDLTLENAALSGEMRLSTGSGDQRLENVSCASLALESSSGTKYLTDVLVSGELKSDSTSGDLTLLRCDAASLDLRTTSGEVRGSLRTEKIFFTDTSSGSVKVPQSMSGGKCEIHTVSGDIKLTVGE